jgi:predicted ATPase
MVGYKGLSTGFIGRAKELNNLKNLLDKSIQGEGKLALISGEAGIGKTRLVSELKRYAQSKEVRCLQGNCIYHEVSDPYLPFVTALKAIEAPSLVDESKKYVMVNEAFLITQGGKVVSYASRFGANIMDQDIVGGMLSAVESFVGDAFGDEETKKKGLDTLVYGPIRIYIDHGKHVFLAVVLSGSEPSGIREDLKNIVNKIETEFLEIVEEWDGDVAKVDEITDMLKGLTLVKYRIRREIKDIDIKKERDRIYEKILQLVIKASTKEPILLILEDIHWADTSSLQLLPYISRNTQDSRVFICATYRPEELDDIGDKRIHPLKESILKMSRYKEFIPIDLNRLPSEDVREMLQSQFRLLKLPEEFLNRVYNETEGNPFFVEEMVQSFEDEGIIQFENGIWKIDKVHETNIPSSIKDTIELRIKRLDEGSMDTIKHASVIGREFDFNLLEKTTALGEEKLLVFLETLEEKKLISVDTTDDELYRFNHSKIREVVYDDLGGHRKRIIHEKAAIAIKDINKDDLDKVVYKLAHHYSKTKDHEDALKYSILAGEKAIREYAMEEAFDFFRLAFNALKSGDETPDKKLKELDILTHLGDICYITGEWDDALKYYHQVKSLCEDLGNIKKMAKAYKNIGLLHLNRNEWDTAQLNLEKGLGLAKETEDDLMLADILYHLGAFYEKRGEFAKAIEVNEESMERAVNIGDSLMIANAYLGIGRVYAQQGQYDESIKNMQESINIFEKINDKNHLAKAYINLGHANFYHGNLDKSILYYEKALDFTKKIGNIRLEGHGLSNLGESYIKKNELEKALRCLDEALKIFKKIDERFMLSDIYIHYGCVYKLKKEWAKSAEYFNNSLEISRELNMPYYIGYGLFEFGMMYKTKNEVKKAREKLSEAMVTFKDLNNQEMLKKIEKELDVLNV